MSFWKLIKQAGILQALSLAALQVWDLITRPSQKLEAEVVYGAFEMPPQIDSLLQLNQEIARGEWVAPTVEKALADSEVPNKYIARIVSRVTWALRDNLRGTIATHLPSSASSLHGLWRVAVSNGGSQPLPGTRLVLPFSSFVVIEREGAKPVPREVDSTIDLDTVHPGEVVRVTAWAKSEPRRPTNESVRLSYATGTGSVYFQHPAGSVGQFADKYWVPLALILPWGLLLLLPLLGRSSSRPQKRAENPVDAEPRNDS